MYTVHVSIRVKEEHISTFKEVSAENAKYSLQEAGVIRFDVLQQQDDPCEFLFVEVYKAPEDQQSHRQTAHFKKWRAAVTNMLATPYSFKLYNHVPLV